MNESQIVVREVGNNPPPDEHRVVHVDMSKTGLFSRLGRIFQPEAPPPRPAPRPPVDPMKELPRQRELLKHLEGQLAIVRARTEEKMPGQMTALQAIDGVKRDYSRRLNLLEDLAAERSTDVGLLWALLDYRGEGLIATARFQIAQLEKQTATPPTVSEEYRKAVADEDKFFVAWGKARKKRRAFEAKQPVGMPRHEYKRPRATYGVDFGRVDENTIQRVAEMACSMADSK